MDVKKLREAAGLTQEELAEKTGIPRDRIAKWEQGKGKPKLEDSLKLNSVLVEEVPKSQVNEPDLKIKPDPMIIISNLTESNRMLAEANLILANKVGGPGPVHINGKKGK